MTEWWNDGIDIVDVVHIIDSIDSVDSFDSFDWDHLLSAQLWEPPEEFPVHRVQLTIFAAHSQRLGVSDLLLDRTRSDRHQLPDFRARMRR